MKVQKRKRGRREGRDKELVQKVVMAKKHVAQGTIDKSIDRSIDRSVARFLPPRLTDLREDRDGNERERGMEMRGTTEKRAMFEMQIQTKSDKMYVCKLHQIPPEFKK